MHACDYFESIDSLGLCWLAGWAPPPVDLVAIEIHHLTKPQLNLPALSR